MLNPAEAVASAAGTTQPGPSPEDYSAMVKIQEEQARQQVRLQRVNVAFGAMAHLNEHCKSIIGTSLSGNEEKLWDLSVAIALDFLKPGASGLKLAE